MFHHFHGQQHPISQGSLDSDHFEAKLQFLTQNFNLLSPTEFTEKITNNEIEIRDICLTFDDALKSQFDIAFPILQKLKLKAFFLCTLQFLRENLTYSRFTVTLDLQNLKT